MRNISREQTQNAIRNFRTCGGELIDFSPYGNGHINATYLVQFKSEKKEMVRYILQAINDSVFKEPLKVMENIERVTAALQKKAADKRSVLHLVDTVEGEKCYFDGSIYWRMYDFLEDSICLELPETKEDFYQCALGFGRFQRELNEFPAESLYETIPDFHNTPKRYRDFLAAVEADLCGRAAGVQREIEFIKQRESFYPVLYENNRNSKLPLRVTHNDTKTNNVMLDAKTRKVLCVIDLDTLMPGFSVNDFGDSIRFGASTAAEDERDLSKVGLDLELFEVYAKGFLEGCGGLLGSDEIKLFPHGAKMMTIECGMRFLTDYLNGDTYFKVKYPDHNLVRCRTQLKLVEEMENHWEEMNNIIAKYA